MAAEKQGPYPPVDLPPAYPGPTTSTVGPPLQGFAPPPGQAPPPGSYPSGQAPPPGAYPAGAYPPGQPMAPPGYVQPGVPPAAPGTYIAGQPVAVQPGVTITQPVVVVNHQFRLDFFICMYIYTVQCINFACAAHVIQEGMPDEP